METQKILDVMALRKYKIYLKENTAKRTGINVSNLKSDRDQGNKLNKTKRNDGKLKWRCRKKF